MLRRGRPSISKNPALANIQHNIAGCARVLMHLGEGNSDSAEEFNYLGGRLYEYLGGRLYEHWKACIAILEDDEEESAAAAE